LAYVRLENITKIFGSVTANDKITFEVEKGEIHALLGENGSGKSTLMNILSGIYAPNSGSIYIGGKEVAFASPKDSIDAGIGMVHQHFKLVDVFTARENIAAGKGSRGFWSSTAELNKRIADIAEKYGLAVELDKKIYDMSVSEKQTVEIMKVLCRGADILILDEPTAVLTPQEIQILFDILRNMKKAGCAVVIITHKLNEVMEISDRVTVLQKGKCIETLKTSETNPQQLTEMMVGKAVNLDIECVPMERGRKLLSLDKVCVKNKENRNALDEVSFDVFSGEILGIAGIAGSGQKELCEAIAGLEKVSEGDIIFKDESIVQLSPRDIIRRGITMSFVPEDRLGMGLVAGMDIVENVLLKAYQNMPGMFINRAEGRRIADDIIERFQIYTPSASHTVKKLSGGNIQKVLLGREINLNPELLITAYPVRGLDIGASYKIYDILNEQKQKGVGIIFVGEDLDVLLHLCDRLMVMHSGKIMDIVDPKSVTKEQVGMLMMGHKQ